MNESMPKSFLLCKQKIYRISILLQKSRFYQSFMQKHDTIDKYALFVVINSKFDMYIYIFLLLCNNHLILSLMNKLTNIEYIGASNIELSTSAHADFQL